LGSPSAAVSLRPPPVRITFLRTGIGILVEVARQLGVGFVKIPEEYKATMLAKLEHVHDRRHKDDPPHHRPRA
jgi:hypothetical protein